MDARLFHRRLFESARALVPPGEVVLCAVSGGADSMAMLYGLYEVNRRRRCQWRLVVAHLDHGLPYDSASVRRFVADAAGALGLEFIADVASVPELSRQWKLSIEEAGRIRRYEFLGESARRSGAKWIAVAHHADDQAETVLHRALRGTGLRGLAGIPRRRRLARGSDVRIVRPVLAFSREQLRGYLLGRELTFMDDPTNGDVTAATRNRVRHDLLPLLEREVNAKVRRALVRLSEQARRSSQAIRQLAREALARSIEAAADGRSATTMRRRFEAVDGDASLLLAVGPLRELPEAIQSEVVSLALDRLGCARKRVTAERIDAAAGLLRTDGQRRRIELPGVRVERRGEWLIVVKRPVSHRTAAVDSPEHSPSVSGHAELVEESRD